MSHWQRRKLERLTNIKAEYFADALKNLGYTADFTIKSVKGFYRSNDENECDCVLFKDGMNTQIGIKFQKDENGISLTILSDWSSATTSERFYSALTKEYNSVMIIGECEKSGYEKETVEELTDGRRRITVRRAA